ncbi:MAG: D-sedoheptulose 7-phosphate isomerase [Candidatus Aminicenantes bacterium]|jgi:D-sedoheptulose 7-phosphate isomerase
MNYRDVIKEWKQISENFFDARESIYKKATNLTIDRLKEGHKILVFGNGGSAAQAQHFVAELVNKFLKERPPIRALSLTTDTSILTSIANDTSFDYVFSRQIEAFGEKGDIALGLSTSGNSPNVIEAMKAAKAKGLVTIALTGKDGGQLRSLVDYLLDVPSEETPRIQEVHILLLHLLAQEIEDKLG